MGETHDTAERYDAVVIGAGFAGLYMVHRLGAELGLTVCGFEAGSGVGGTWYWNRYPGARTDSLHSIYRYSFSEDLSREWSYTERYPGQPEVLSYLEWAADRLDVRRAFRFNTRVVAAHWDDADRRWEITTDRGDAVRASYLVTAVGLLSAPNVPPFPGLETFTGVWYHSADWPASVDLAGKRVALVGTGSTGIQMLPHLADQAAQVTVLQRTPNYVVPAQNRPLNEQEKADFRDRHREVAERIRQHPFAMPFTSRGPSALAVDERARTEIYQEAWDKGGFHFLFESFEDLQLDEAANETACEFIRARIRETVRDPETAELLCPRGYPYGAKRPPAGTHYYETFNRDNVRLVDVSGDPIEAVTPTGLRTATRELAADVIVFATGFDASTGSFDRIDIRGRGGLTLTDKWRDGPVAHLGLGVRDFPNLLMVTGPLSPFANIPTCIEETGDWIVGALAHLRKNGLSSIEATATAEHEWTRHTREVADMIMAGRGTSVHTWFAGANIEGKPRAINVYFGGANNFFAACRAAAEQDYQGFDLR